MQKGTISLLTSPWSHTGWKRHVIASTLGCVAISSLLLLAACGGDSGSNAKETPVEDIAPREVETVYDMGRCTADREGDSLYVMDVMKDFLCTGGNWLDLNPAVPESSNAPSSSFSTPIDNPAFSSASTRPDPVATLYELGACSEAREGELVYVISEAAYFKCSGKKWSEAAAPSSSSVALSSSSACLSGQGAECHGEESSSSVLLTDVETVYDLGRCDTARQGERIFVKADTTYYTCDSAKWVADKVKGFVIENRSIMGVAQKGPFEFNSSLVLRELNDTLAPTGRTYDDEISSNKGDFVIPKVSLVYPYASLEVTGRYRNEVTGGWSEDSITLRVLTDLVTIDGQPALTRTEANINLLTHLEYNRAAYLVRKGYSVFAAKKQADQEIMTAFDFATTIKYSEDLVVFRDANDAELANGNATLLAISILFLGDRTDAQVKQAIDKFIADITPDGEWNDPLTKADMADFAYELDYSTVRAMVKSWNILEIPSYETYLTAFWNNTYGLGGCTSVRNGVVAQNTNELSKRHDEYFTCASGAWRPSTTFEKDTYGWASGKSGDLKKGDVTDTVYVYNDGWKVSPVETAIGMCTTAGKLDSTNNVWYICRDSKWQTATALEYDTYGKTCTDGIVIAGNVNENNYYACDGGTWRTATTIEKDLNGVCNASRDGFVGKSGSTYYICKSNAWTTASALEYDTYGVTCTDGIVVAGKVNTSSYYACDGGTWRTATTIEKDLNGVCNASREGFVGKSGSTYYICKSNQWTTASALEYDTYGQTCTEGKVVAGNVNTNNYYICDGGKWRTATYIDINSGTMTDSRDGKTYKTIKIGSQIWMAENLNYEISDSWCYGNKEENCEKYGRLYTWAAAMSAVPNGWHLPTNEEWDILATNVGGVANAGTKLKSKNGWNSGNGTDDYGFAAFSAGHRSSGSFYSLGSCAYFWSADEYSSAIAYSRYFNTGASMDLDGNNKSSAISVRLVKDSE